MRVEIKKGTEGGLDLIPGKVSFVQFDLKSLYLQLSLTQGILLSYLFGENKDVQGQAIYRVTPKQCNIRIFVSESLRPPIPNITSNDSEISASASFFSFLRM